MGVQLLPMKQTATIISTYSADVFGVCSALFELGGMVIMLWNTIKTATAGRVVPVQIPAVAAHA